MPRDSRKGRYEVAAYSQNVLTASFGIHTSLAATGIFSNRIVNANTEAPTVGETTTDNQTVGFVGTANSVATVFLGVVKDGATPFETGTILMPGTNNDFNVTVTLLGIEYVEVAPASAITVGSLVNVDAVGRAAATGTATPFIALTAANGTGTATAPEYIQVLVR